MDNDQKYIEECKRLIEKKLAWGDSQSWQNQNFESLSLLIFEETNVSLSNSTLKRLWGKVKYDSNPNLTTLNALAQYIGYVNWRQFIKNINNNTEANNTEYTEAPSAQLGKEKNKPVNYKLIITATSIVVLFFLILIWAFRNPKNSLVFKNVQFSSTPVTKGLPNTVVFHYNAAESNADSVFIQQSWDPARRYRVNKNLHEYTSTYYTPGYFRAKLILNDSIVKEHDLFVESDGWMGTIDYKPIPTYIDPKKLNKNEIIGIGINDLPDKQEFKNKKLWTTLHNVSEKMMVPSESFSMETELRSTYAEEDGICQFTEVLLLGSEGVIIIPLSIKGCVGEIVLNIGSKQLNGRIVDLSAFGVDFHEFINVKCAVKNKRIKILVNENVAYEGEFNNSIGKIVGTRIRFRGSGEVRKFKMTKN